MSNNIIIKAFSYLAPDYEKIVDAEIKFFWGWSYRGLIQKLIEVTPIEENEKILDIATGVGIIPESLINQSLVSVPVHGLDITLSMLEHAKSRFTKGGIQDRVPLVCANAIEMPYTDEAFTRVICGLATHHMSVEQLLMECQRVLCAQGRLSIADAGGSLIWKFPGIKLLVRVVAFLYYSLTEDFSRAWAEASAVSNVMGETEWFSLLTRLGFGDISIIRLDGKNSWISAPLIISAVK